MLISILAGSAFRKCHWNADPARMEILRVEEKDIPPGEYVQMHLKEKCSQSTKLCDGIHQERG